MERFFQIENLADPENLEIQHNIILALRAHNLMSRPACQSLQSDGSSGFPQRPCHRCHGIPSLLLGDFIVNEKDKVVNLTLQGVSKVERFFQIENLADPENLEIVPQYKLFFVYDHIIAQIIKTKLIIGDISNV